MGKGNECLHGVQKGHGGDLRFPGTFKDWAMSRWERCGVPVHSFFLPYVQALLELWSVPPRPRSLSLPQLLFLLHTLPPRSSQSGREAFFLISYSHLGPTVGPERTYPDVELSFLLVKLNIIWKMGVKDTQEPGQRQGHGGVWSQDCLWNFNHSKVWKGNCMCTYIQRDCSL